MSATTIYVLLINLLLLLLLLGSSDMTAAARNIPSSVPSTMRSLGSETGNYVKMKPHLDHKQPIFQARDAKSCLPKGFRRTSAPSRYVNYEPLGVVACSDKHSKKP
ncbi:hypothetical protein HS088_TW02G00578 [Tripterygium wilfordii]|uniref:Uncharacterized protein n=1 Tax=Tripterygium wilfordii TaxID=458696 RepID=A0A7J7DZ24_TRIWF|nr:hypothetical protein HS088_TW02G00578 [Tripterygium wilfordii]